MMAAHLYNVSVLEPLQKRFSSEFEQAVRDRDLIVDKRSIEFFRAHDMVQTIYHLMWSKKGYFKDPYNPHSVFWALGLSWWSLVIPMLDRKNNLKPNVTQQLIKIIENRYLDLRLDQKEIGEEYFEKARRDILNFLKYAVTNDQHLNCVL